MDMVKEPQELSLRIGHWTGIHTHHSVEYITPYQTQWQEASLHPTPKHRHRIS